MPEHPGSSVSAPPSDEFAGQKNNIRDTAKWMATAYAAIAAVLVAGAPFSGLGTLPNCRLAIAATAGAVTIICILLAINSILSLLIGDYCFANSLDNEAKVFIDKHAGDVLPIQFDTLEKFMAHRRSMRGEAINLWNQLTDSNASSLTEDERKAITTEYKGFQERSMEAENNVARIISLAHLYLLRRRLDGIRLYLAVLTGVAIVSLFVAVWSATPEKKPKAEMGKAASAQQFA